MFTLHPVDDATKVITLAASMERDGWVGAPLVVWGEQLITGTHRYAAAQSLGWAISSIPTIDLPELFAQAGLDLDALHAEYGEPTVDEWAFVQMVNELPEAIRDEYGIDLH